MTKCNRAQEHRPNEKPLALVLCIAGFGAFHRANTSGANLLEGRWKWLGTRSVKTAVSRTPGAN